MSKPARYFALLLLLWLPHFYADASEVMALELDTRAKVPDADSLPPAPRPVRYSYRELLRTRRLNINDTSVVYPRFVEFCLNVYRWVDQNLNTYDPDYVQSTGKSGKVRLVNENWSDQYYFRIHEGMPIMMVTNPYTNVGFAVNYSIIGFSHLWDLSTLTMGYEPRHRKSSVGISTARITLDAHLRYNQGPTTLLRFGNEESGGVMKASNFTGVDFETYGINARYIFNWRRFCRSAPYDFSDYQIKSAGSWIAGLIASFYHCNFDFSKLHYEQFLDLELPISVYRLHYYVFALEGGYSYNWVLGNHWLFNATALPALGVSFSYQNSTVGKRTLPGAAFTGMLGLTYCNRQFFAGISLRSDNSFFLTENVRFISSLGNIKLQAGVRF